MNPNDPTIRRFMAAFTEFAASAKRARDAIDRLVIQLHPELQAWDAEMSNCYPN